SRTRRSEGPGAAALQPLGSARTGYRDGVHSSEPAIILDVDGTLVDTNYHHALAWFRAFRRHGVVLPLWRIHRHMGMGGDQLVAAVAGEEAEEKLGDSIRAAEKDLYGELIGEVEPLEGARELLEELHEARCCVVLASSAK